MVKVDLRTITLNIPPQEVITKDNVPVRVNAVAYFRIVEPKNAIVQVENFMVATSQIAQTTLRSVLGQHLLDELLSERDKINAILQEIIDEATAPWGIKVSIVEVKDVEIPSGMQRAMARQAEAERERRAKVIAAEGEFQASERLKDAALVIEDQPIGLQLRYLQTLVELGSSQSTTIVFPAPIDLLTPFLEQLKSSEHRPAGRPALRRRLVAVAPGRSEPPGRRRCRCSSRSTPEALDARARSARAARTGRRPRCSRCREARAAGHARLAGARRPEQVPGVRAPGGGRPSPAAPRARSPSSTTSSSSSSPRPGACASEAARESGHPYVFAGINEGRAAGASLQHSHSQLVWLGRRAPGRGSRACRGRLPVSVNCCAASRTTARASSSSATGSSCLCPFASRSPYECLVAPLEHEADGFASELPRSRSRASRRRPAATPCRSTSRGR